MTYHYANIISWEYFVKQPSLNRKIFIDGFLLQLAIFVVTGRWIPKNSGLNSYTKHEFSQALHLSAKALSGVSYFKLPFWSSLEEIIVEDSLMLKIEPYSVLVIGISSPKQERLAELIQARNMDCDIYCFGAAVYAKQIIRSEFVLVTLFTMFFNAPTRTLRKLIESVYKSVLAVTMKRNDLKEFVKLVQDYRT